MICKCPKRMLWLANKLVLYIVLMTIVCTTGFIDAKLVNANNSGPLISYRELRYNYMFGQTSWWSCGPASIATLLHYYYKIDTSEQDVIQLVTEISNSDEYINEGIDLLLIKKIFGFYGVEAIGYRVDTASLSSYYDQGGFPLILYFTSPKKHYVIGIGKIGKGELLVADPSFGHLVLNLSSLENQKGFNGVVLATIPSQESQLRSITAMQSEMLSIYKSRRTSLANIK